MREIRISVMGPLRLALVALTVACAGCRLGRYSFEEPIRDMVLEVKSGDRWHFVLDEPSGTDWSAETDDDLVSLTVRHLRADRKADVEMRVHRGYVDGGDVRIVCRRFGEDRPFRRVTVALWRKVEDVAPWK